MSEVETWFRNPSLYIRELVEVPEARRIIWDRGLLIKKRIDPWKHASLYFDVNDNWQVMVCGEQGTALLDKDHDMTRPKAVFPTWVYGEDDLEVLEDMIANPVGEDEKLCRTRGEPDEVPVYGQEHRVILTNLPKFSMGSSKTLIRTIREIVEDYPDSGVKIHIHGLYSFNGIFSQGFYAGDYEARSNAALGNIVLPTGKLIKAGRYGGAVHWINLMDMSVAEMKVPRNRCIFAIKSFLWAGHYWAKDLNFKTVGAVNVDPRQKALQSHRGARVILGNPKENKPQPGDLVVCNSCSLQDKCKYFREGAVCSLPESEISVLADYFKSRDSSRIIDALGTVLGAQAKRLEKGIELEEEYGEMDPEVTKQMNALFNNGVKLAKLIDPMLSKPGVQINLGSSAIKSNSNPRQLVKHAMQALEDSGISKEDITPAMLESMLTQMIGKAEPMEADSTGGGQGLVVYNDAQKN